MSYGCREPQSWTRERTPNWASRTKQCSSIAKKGSCSIINKYMAWMRKHSMHSMMPSSSRRCRSYWKKETTTTTMAMALPSKSVVRFPRKTPPHLSSGINQERQTPPNTTKHSLSLVPIADTARTTITTRHERGHISLSFSLKQ
jgi:hypothetical protein